MRRMQLSVETPVHLAQAPARSQGPQRNRDVQMHSVSLPVNSQAKFKRPFADPQRRQRSENVHMSFVPLPGKT